MKYKQLLELTMRENIDLLAKRNRALRKELDEAKAEIERKCKAFKIAGYFHDKKMKQLADSESKNKELIDAALWLAKCCRDGLPEGQIQKIDEEIRKVEALAKYPEEKK